MAQQQSSLHSKDILPSEIIAEGKTKRIVRIAHDPYHVLLQAKDDITAFNKEKHDLIDGKAQFATDTTCNVFSLLKSCGVPVAFEKQINKTTFMAPNCTMIPYEVIVRREAHGSFLKRAKHLKKGNIFPQLIVEFFLKTNEKNWNGNQLPKDDPFIVFQKNKMVLYQPDIPLYAQEPCLTLNDYPLKNKPELFTKMERTAKQTFLVLEKAWQNLGKKLVDFKVEFGFDQKNNLLLADVIDNDSWRVVENDSYLDKQFYRDGGNLTEVEQKYRRVRDLTKQFNLARQQIILWRGSPKDDLQAFEKELEPLRNDYFSYKIVTTSIHKSPVIGYLELQELIQKIPDTVVIAYIGRSNGAGPTLSANTSAPVITVPASWKSCPQDVWSSLRTPSKTPVMTVLEPTNAIKAALHILAMRSPAFYATIRLEQEPRLSNVIAL